MFTLHKRILLSIGLLPVVLFALFAAEANSADAVPFAVTSAESHTPIPATLIKPDGDGPFPAVVIMHDCSGLGLRSSGAPARWADDLVRQGYVVVIPDSFSARGFAAGTCLVPRDQSSSVNGSVRAADAYGALAALRTLPYVDGRRVGLMGGSHGGWTTLTAIVAPRDARDLLAAEKRDGFAAAVALYPSCAPRYGAWSTWRAGANGPATAYSGVYQPLAPLLILIGEKDDWTLAETCRRLAEASRAAGLPVDIKIYADAYHSFDSDHPVRYDARRSNASAPSGYGATTGGNPAAWADARKQVVEFFARNLKQQQ